MKKLRRENTRVIVEPDTRFMVLSKDEEKRQKEIESRCQDIVTDIKRHVNDVANAYVDFDFVGTCEFCGASWTEDDDQFNGGCCDKDIENEPS